MQFNHSVSSIGYNVILDISCYHVPFHTLPIPSYASTIQHDSKKFTSSNSHYLIYFSDLSITIQCVEDSVDSY